ncbi:J domain-containing protein [Nesterenkonia sp. LB17]|uniref:J domain-containing protein n=1 Tax=Nesterenkonia sp. LB17 TaxID=2901230 RepID=UPI001F4D3013|nr:J domain-containing protein [Nesterenkonia sp. LB17]MCH8564464.1 J domain-containing protein [Nesterenkonia sp. LB17]
MSSHPGDLYSVLGIGPDADAQAVRAAYRKQARRAHPDAGGTAEEFHEVQSAWEVLGDESARAAYDRRLRQPQRAEADEDAQTDGPTYGRGPGFGGTGFGGSGAAFRTTASGSTSARSSSADSARTPSGTAHLAPVYIPDLSRPEPLSLPLTSQRTHGRFASRGIFGGGRARRAERMGALLEKHVLAELPTARLFNAVALEPAGKDRRGASRPPRGPAVDHVLVCGDTLVVVSSLEVPAAAASWDGRRLHAAGRSLALPDLTGESRLLRATLEAAMRETGRETSLNLGQQIVLHSPDGGMQSPVVESRGTGAGRAPLAPARAFRSIREQLAASAQANVIDRHLLAALRRQLQHPQE